MVANRLAIHGHGILPGLLAVHVLAREPGQGVLLLSPDRSPGGEHLEPVVANRLSAAARALVDPFVVSHWPAYYLVDAGAADLQEETVLLLDPLQVWLELDGHGDRVIQIAPCGAISREGGRLSWNGGSAQVDRFVDLEALTGPGGESEIVGVDAARRLALPVLADYDAGEGEWAAQQYLPLGDERLVVRKLPRAAHLIGAQTSFETILNELVAA